ncbi:hypothetical protein GCM10023169_33450 [Georgenia halophila]|uniref:Zinc finger CGNR domain-containing protein n=1 Tax=Georgenia halophila TaxID=620889 RepID=A0ABP8LK33_9MICO
MVEVPKLEMAEVIEIVNSYAAEARAAAHDEHKGYPLLAEVVGGTADAFPAVRLTELQSLAGEAYEVFVAAEAGSDVAGPVNALLAPAAPTPTCTSEGGIEWEVHKGADTLRASIAIALLDWLHTRGAERLGTCHGTRCGDAFADLSPSGRKIYCSNGCLNRHKVAEHRRRARSA